MFYSNINNLLNFQTSHLNLVAIQFDKNGIYKGFTDQYSTWMVSCPVIWKKVGKNLLKFANNYRHVIL